MRLQSFKKLASVIVLLVAACAPQPKLNPLSSDATILAFGDSITYGTGADDSSTYPKVLEQLTGRRVINAGIPGEVTAQGLARLPAELGEVKPALMILCLGGNDMIRKLGEQQAAENLRQMIRISREQGVEVVLIGVPRPGVFLNAADFYKQIADEMAVVYESDALKKILSDNSLKSDYIHPNAKGYRELAEAIAELLKKRGAL
ncbi:MAG: arylesterase [Nitrospirota bacterium]|nr:arylesterase [Nitrospirota bacterium]